MRARLWAAATSLVLGASVVACGGSTAGEGAGAEAVPTRVRAIDTQVEHAPGGDDFELIDGATDVTVGDRARTDAGGFGEISYADGSLSRLDVSTEVTLTALPAAEVAEIEVAFDVGRTWHRVRDVTASDGRFDVVTSVATATVRGTAFSVDCRGDGCLFSVVEGVVDVTTTTGATVTLAAGQSVLVAPDGTPGGVGAVSDDDGWIARNLDLDEEVGFARPPTDGGDGGAAAPPPQAELAADLLVAHGTGLSVVTRNGVVLPGAQADGAQLTDVTTGGLNFLAVRETGGSRTFVRVNGGQLEPIGVEGAVRSPSVSSTGQLAFIRGTGASGDVVVSDLAGNNARTLASGTAVALAEDGSRLAYVDGNMAFFLAPDAPGTEQRYEALGPLGDVALSPDGSLLAWWFPREVYEQGWRVDPGPQGGFQIVDLAAGRVVNIVGAGLPVEGGVPAWSPDGAWIAWVREGREIVIAPMNSQGERVLAEVEGALAVAWLID